MTRFHRTAVAAAVAACALGVTSAAFGAVGSGVAAGTLTVTSDGSDAIALTCVAGSVKVNGADPASGPASCVSITKAHVLGGPGANTIDVSDAGLPGGTSYELDGKGGDDLYTALWGTDVSVGDSGTAGADELRVVGTSGRDYPYVADGSVDAFANGVAYAGVEQVTVDMGAGDDSYAVVLGSLGTSLTIADSGSGDADTLRYSPCDGSDRTSTSVTVGAETVSYSGIEQPIGCWNPPLQPCSATQTQRCVSSFTVDGAAPTANIRLGAYIYGDSVQVGFYNADDPYGTNLLAAPDPLSLASLIQLTLNVGTADPAVFVATGSVAALTTTHDALNGNTLTVVLSPQPASWSFMPCPPSNCTVAQADLDDAGVAAVYGSGADTQSAAFATQERGLWISTNASGWQLPAWNAATSSVEFEVAAPHLRHDGTPYLGTFSAFVPDALLSGLLGGASWLGVTDTTGGATTPVPATVTRVTGGLRVDASGFGYSGHRFAIAKAPAPAPAVTPAPAAAPAPASGGGGEEAPAAAAPAASEQPATPAQQPEAAPQAPAIAATLAPVLHLTRPTLVVRVNAPAGAVVKATLKRNGKVVATWTRRAGSGPLRLSLPTKARKPGAYRLTVASGGATKTLPVRIVR